MSESTSGLLWSILLITVIGVGALLIFTVAWAYRKRIRADSPTGAFTLHELREMLASGAISQVEFETMRAAILEQARGSDESDTNPTPPERPPESENGQSGTEDDNIQP